jgi:deoxyribodipyrimidine photolyase
MIGFKGLQAMSKKLEKKASKLVRKAEDRATVIRRVVREYNNVAQTSAGNDSAKQREIERAVVRYNEVHKAIKRLRRKMALKSKQPQSLGIRRAKYSRAK